MYVAMQAREKKFPAVKHKPGSEKLMNASSFGLYEEPFVFKMTRFGVKYLGKRKLMVRQKANANAVRLPKCVWRLENV